MGTVTTAVPAPTSGFRVSRNPRLQVAAAAAGLLTYVAAVALLQGLPLLGAWAVLMLALAPLTKAPLLRATVGVVRKLEWLPAAALRLVASRGVSGWIARLTAVVITDSARAVVRVLLVAAAMARDAGDALRAHANVCHVALTLRVSRAPGSATYIAAA